jgi:hypothetical protein
MFNINKNKFYEAYPDFSSEIYKNNNKIKYLELNKLINDNDIINHFLNNNSQNIKYSALPENFSIDIYKYYNFDLLNLSDNQLIKHYIDSGMKEKRIATIDDFYRVNPNFDRYFYINLYGDLQYLPIKNLIKHYIYFGRCENRLTGIQDFYKAYPNFSKTITDVQIIKKYINDKNNKNKNIDLKIDQFNSTNGVNVGWGETEFYEKFIYWNYEIYSCFNILSVDIQNQLNQSNQPNQHILISMIDFLIKFNLGKKIIYSLETFYDTYSMFNYNNYRSDNKSKFNNFSEVEVIIYWYKNEYNNISYNSKTSQTNFDQEREQEQEQEQEQERDQDKEQDKDKERELDLLNQPIEYIQSIEQLDNYFFNHPSNSFPFPFPFPFPYPYPPLSYALFDQILIYIHDEFKTSDGGIIVQYYLAKSLDNIGYKVRILNSKKNVHNPIFNNFYYDGFDLSRTLVIYCEGIIGNPLGAKYSMRWILSELGINVPSNRYLTWSTNEIVYYFNRESKFEQEKLKVGIIYKELSLLYIDPKLLYDNTEFEIFNTNSRTDYCYTLRKCYAFNKNINFIHPDKSFEIIREHSQSDCIEIFKKHKYFISYDPLTFYQIIAILCGCITIIYPLPNHNKIQWLQKTAVWSYLEENNLDNLYGIAYGIEDLEYAESTLFMVKDQWKDIDNFYKKVHLKNFVQDLNKFNNLLNTVENNFSL